MEEILHHLEKLPTSTGELAGFLPSTVPFHHLSLKIDLIPSWVLEMTTGRPSWNTRIQAMFARNGVVFPGNPVVVVVGSVPFFEGWKTHQKPWDWKLLTCRGFLQYVCVFFALFGWNLKALSIFNIMAGYFLPQHEIMTLVQQNERRTWWRWWWWWWWWRHFYLSLDDAISFQLPWCNYGVIWIEFAVIGLSKICCTFRIMHLYVSTSNQYISILYLLLPFIFTLPNKNPKIWTRTPCSTPIFLQPFELII